jgi:hypothetical protein
MCYGKMILNLYNIEDCPTLSYTGKYPLAMNVFEQYPLSSEIVAALKKPFFQIMEKESPSAM